MWSLWLSNVDLTDKYQKIMSEKLHDGLQEVFGAESVGRSLGQQIQNLEGLITESNECQICSQQFDDEDHHPAHPYQAKFERIFILLIYFFELYKVPSCLLLWLLEKDSQKRDSAKQAKLSELSSNFSREGYQEGQAELSKPLEIQIRLYIRLCLHDYSTSTRNKRLIHASSNMLLKSNKKSLVTKIFVKFLSTLV